MAGKKELNAVMNGHDITFQSRTEALQQWEIDRQFMRAGHPATALLAEGMPIEPAPAEVTTATTDGTRLLVNPEWSAGLDDTTRRFMHAHLVWHCAAGHIRMQPAPSADPRHWHLACDHEVNATMLMLGIPLSPQAVLFPACTGKPLTGVYAWLADNPLLDYEHSLDASPWYFVTADPSHVETWTQRVHELVKSHLGSPELPTSVASWLLSRW